jgi:hypothetical protein
MATSAVSEASTRTRGDGSDTPADASQPSQPSLTALLLLCPQAPKTKLLINGEFIDSKTSKWIPVKNPVRMQQSSSRQTAAVATGAQPRRWTRPLRSNCATRAMRPRW